MFDYYRYKWLIAIFVLFTIGTCKQTTSLTKHILENEVPLEQIKIMVLESFPVQVNIIARGKLPNDCTMIDEITEGRNGNTLTLKISTTRQTNEPCTTEEGETFEEIIPLNVAGLSAGVYTVKVNDQSEIFELGVDNIIH